MTPRQAFGDELRRARERRGVSLEAIARDTKITRSLLEGLERGDCSRWPGGIYSRAYVRDYARAVGLPPDDTAARFVARFATPAEHAAAASAHVARARHSAHRQATPTDEAAERALAVLALADTPEPEPDGLRLGLADDRGSALLTVLSRARLLAIDAMMIAGGAAILASATAADFWISAAGTAFICHALGVLRSGDSAATASAAWLRRAAATRPAGAEAPSESIVESSA